MKLYPAIDLRNGKCVRLKQGDYARQTVFGEDPVEMALKWQSLGASYLHLVDLDGAKEGRSINLEAIREIVKALSIPIQLGGGIRNIEAIQSLLELGVDRVILGSSAVKDPQLVKEAVKRFGANRIVVGVDARDGKVATEGWLEKSDLSAPDFCLSLKEMGVKTVIYTDISKDGMMEGPNIKETRRLMKESGLEVIASGGVSSMEDLRGLKAASIQGAIIGKALYVDAIDLKEAIAEIEKGETDAE